MRARLPAVLPPLLLVLLPLLTYWPATRGEVVFNAFDGLVMFMPLRAIAADAWRAGVWPLWNPWVFSGFPLLGSGVAGALFPINALYLVLAPLAAMTWTMLACLVALGLGTYAYTRALGCTRAAALFAGITMLGCGFVVARTGNTPMVNATPWLPLTLLALERLRGEARVRWVALGAGSVALGVLTGHPQVSVTALYVAAAAAAWRGLVTRPPIGRLRFLALAAATLAAGLLLAAPQLLPIAELAGQSVRDALTFADFLEFALAPGQLALLLFPMLDAAGTDPRAVPYTGMLEQSGYAGVAAIMLALAAVAAVRRSAVVAFWTVVALLSLGLVLGDATPLGRLAHHLPVFNLFRIPTRSFYQFDLAVAVLAAIGLTRVQRRVGRRALALAAPATALAMLAIAAALPWPWSDARLALPLLLAAAACTLALALALALARRPLPWLVAALVALQAGDLFLFGQQLLQPVPRAATALAPPTWVTALRDLGGERVAVVEAAGSEPADYRLALWGLRQIGGYDSLLMRRYAAFAGDMDYAGRIPSAALVGAPLFLDLLAVRAVALRFPGAPAALRIAETPFAYPELGVALGPGEVIEFPLPASYPVGAVAAMTFLSGAVGVGQGDPAVRVTLVGADGERRTVELLAGVHTGEWAWERPDVSAAVRHRRPPVAERFSSDGSAGNKYVGVLDVAPPLDAVRVRVENLLPSSQLLLSRLTLLDAARQRMHALSLAHLLLDRPQRWAPRATLSAREPARRAAPMLGAEWIGARLGRTAPPAREPFVDQVVLLENRLALPHVWLVPRTLAVDGGQALSSVRSGRLPDGTPFDPRAVALVEAAPSRDFGPLTPAATAAVVAARPQHLEIATRADAPAFLVVSEVAYPGWQATIDGTAAPIVRTNGVLRGVALPAGAHRVVFTYRSRPLQLGLALAAATLLALPLAALWSRRAR